MDIQLLALAIFAYFLGAIPFALVVSKLKGVDLRKQGSGNLGATNVFRVMGWKWGAAVFLLDGIKGIGFIAIIGHTLSVFARFKGGKGAATGLGVILALSPDVFGILLTLAVILISTTRYVAPVTILCSVLTPILQFLLGYPEEYVIVTSIIAVFIVIRHKENIRRLIRGEENRI